MRMTILDHLLIVGAGLLFVVLQFWNDLFQRPTQGGEAKTVPVPFGSLKPGERFEHGGEAWKKLGDGGQPLNNAMMLARRQTAYFLPDKLVRLPYVQSLSFWRKWLISRSLRWQLAGFPWWAKWSWRLARILAAETTHQALAAHAAQLLMMGE